MKKLNKIVIIPDSFKGTMTSSRVAEIISLCAKRHFPECETVCIPVADGGEGSVDCFLDAVGGEKVRVKVSGPFFDKIESYYGIINGGKTAVIETASCAGLPLVSGRENPSLTTTYGIGEMMLHAAERGCSEIIVGLGGSCTNDCATGMASGAGAVFYNKDNEPFIPTGGTLKDICRVDISKAREKFKNIKISAMCDVTNPLYGKTGAAYIFAGQKGADGDMIKRLDDGLRHTAQLIKKCLDIDVSSIPGGGAAGGMGAGIYAFFSGELKSGIETVLDTVHFDEMISDADLVITGEGKFDSQSLGGKVIDGISLRAKKQGVPVIVIAGDVKDEEILSSYDKGISAVFPINRVAKNFDLIKNNSEEFLQFTADNIFRMMKL